MPHRKETLLELIEALLSLVEKGIFVIMKGNNHRTGPCVFCEYQQACDVYRPMELDRKYQDKENTENFLKIINALFCKKFS